MNNNITSNNAIVDQISQINFTGNIIPSNWFNTIVDAKGRPNLRAINFLADIIYWYRASEERDHNTGKLVSFKKKFKGSALQRSYEQLSAQFNCSKRQAKEAIDFLVDIGAIEREFRSLNINGLIVHNVMFLTPIPEVIKTLTFYDSSDIVTPPTKKCSTSIPKNADDPTEDGDINTETSIEINSENIIPSIHHVIGGLIDINTLHSWDEELDNLFYEGDFDSVEAHLSELVFPEGKDFCKYQNEMNKKVYEYMLQVPHLLSEMVFEEHGKKYNGCYVASGTRVLQSIQTILKKDYLHNLYEYASRASRNFLAANENTNFRNPLSYFKSVL